MLEAPGRPAKTMLGRQMLLVLCGLVASWTPWAERLAARTGATPVKPAADDTTTVEAVVTELRSFVQSSVEPAMAVLRERERGMGGGSSNKETCFGTVAGAYLRYRCCVYYSSLAAALLEQRFGAMTAQADRAAPTASPYQAMARWLLEPPADADPVARALAVQLQAESRSVAALHTSATRLPGPLGRYSARLTVLGVPGTLSRCEMGTVHTFLLFVADGGRLDDVYIDVTFKQFLVLPDWMETRHYEAAERLGLFRQFPDAFVGTAEELAALMTLSALRTALEAAYAAAPDAAPSRISSFVNETALRTAPVAAPGRPSSFVNEEQGALARTTRTVVSSAAAVGARDASANVDAGKAGSDGDVPVDGRAADRAGDRAGDQADDVPPFARPGALETMHALRNDGLFALNSPARRRGMCGRPVQHEV
jgi:hypothetical protein